MRFIRVALLTAALAIVAAIAPAQSVKTRYVMSVQGITPPSGFQVLSFSWGISNPVLIGAGSGMQAGRPSMSSFNIMKSFDGFSAQLANACNQGSQAATARVQGFIGDSTSPFLEIVLSPVMVESAQLSGSQGSVLSESVSFAFFSMTINGVTLSPAEVANTNKVNEMIASIVQKVTAPKAKAKATVSVQ